MDDATLARLLALENATDEEIEAFGAESLRELEESRARGDAPTHSYRPSQVEGRYFDPSELD
ncbi:hypothetical protein [Streptomyces sp. NPDC001985]|uniref:hypothetical protein n=1 Tax=Streptomyces sp. NPDC001985 TaxID=3154406 RepID=UPI00332ACFBE